MSKYFEGWYYKHQKGDNVVAFIPGMTNHSAFIQVITPDASYHVLYPLNEYERNDIVRVGDNVFSKDGAKINIKDDKLKVLGEMAYSNLIPIKHDVMGVFKYFPMECYHGVISMRHDLYGSLVINGKTVDFTKGVGYIETDRGTSFPKTYLWTQCNDFNERCSIMVSIADIPFYGFHFKGCIGIVHYKNKEYRLATYLGVKIERYSDKRTILRQNKLLLVIDVIKNDGQKLLAPQKGDMARTIHECASCKARYRFWIHGELVFDMTSNHASFEFVK